MRKRIQKQDTWKGKWQVADQFWVEYTDTLKCNSITMNKSKRLGQLR